MQHILIGGAWPYANGSLHAGQIAALLPGDVLARYYRQKGHPVLYVSGSDCHGTPIAIRAAGENRPPAEIAGHYHEEFDRCFRQLGFSYDCYSRTDQPAHAELVQQVFSELLAKGILYPRTINQAYCRQCARFLPDRYVEGSCPNCGAPARGDQCEQCTRLLEPQDLRDGRCKLCGQPVSFIDTEHYYFALTRFQDFLEGYLAGANSGFRLNAVKETRRYLTEKLKDRAATRDLEWGIPVPLAGYEHKRIYVWIEAVLGYLSASQEWSRQTGRDWRPFWSDGALSWYVHGKDNIPFHTIFLPSLLYGYDKSLKLPDRILSSEYLTLEGRKISTSQNWAIWISDLIDRYPADSIRYYLLLNGPERRDADFSWAAFIHGYNSELLGDFGNLVNRTAQFIRRHKDGCTPNEDCETPIRLAIGDCYTESGVLLEKGEIKAALERIFDLVHLLNRYFDQKKPWLTLQSDPDDCDRALASCLHGIINLTQLLGPYLPFACARVRKDFGIAEKPGWAYVTCPAGRILGEIQILFPRLDVGLIEEERRRLGGK
ncbi:MAG TPA: methionine--tRNA ligase [Clostridiales bacterium]|nr:methionine--tRNA ligase [Clostridiales bacterium]